KDNSGLLRPGMNWMDSRGQTMTTLRYMINQKTNWKKRVDCTGNGGWPQICGGAASQWAGEGGDVPPRAPHSGGVNVLFGDGSVHFLTDSVPLLTLARLATRDDGAFVQFDP